MASVGPLLAPGWVNQARMSSRRRCRGPSELGELVEAGGDTAAEAVDDPGHGRLPGGLVGVAVGGDDVLVDAPADLDRQVLVVGEEGGEPGLLSVGEQALAGPQRPARRIQGVAGVAAMAEGVVLDALPGQVELVADQGDHVEGVIPTSG